MDAAGNVTTCIQYITISDTIAPVIICLPPITYYAGPDMCGAVINYTLLATDNCGEVTLSLYSGLPSGSVFPVGTSTVVMIATDACGNTTTCTFTVDYP